MKSLLKNIIIILMSFVILVTLTACEDKNETTDINYEVVTDSNIITELEISDKKTRGYEIIEKDEFYYLVIKHGEEPTWYGDLKVTKVENDGSNLKVWVELPNGGIGEAFSYPTAILKLDKEPDKVKIIYN